MPKLQDHRSFILTLLAVGGCIALAFYRPGTEPAVLTTLPILIGTYIGARSTEKIMSVKAAAVDPNANLAEIIKTTVK